jgi:hypothetical protein
MFVVCSYCDEPIEAGNGSRGAVPGGAIHDECFTRLLMGGINHLRGTCSCHGGTDEPDPPYMTKRQAAIAADAFFEGARRRGAR